MNNVYLYIILHLQEKGKENVRAQILKFYLSYMAPCRAVIPTRCFLSFDRRFSQT